MIDNPDRRQRLIRSRHFATTATSVSSLVLRCQGKKNSPQLIARVNNGRTERLRQLAQPVPSSERRSVYDRTTFGKPWPEHWLPDVVQNRLRSPSLDALLLALFRLNCYA